LDPAPPSAPLAPAPDVRLVLTTVPPGEARALAARLVEEGLAACVNVIPGVRSLFRWEGSLEDAPESLLVVKTRQERLEALAARIQALHPYEVPEILALPVAAGSPAYLAWLFAATSPPPPAPPSHLGLNPGERPGR
jgi:periplasmic divalent cation tolerance protein